MATADLLQDSLNGSTPSRIGRFVLDSELGRGRMGAVYKATDSENGQTVAIRIIQLFRFSAEPDAARIRLRDSARAASGLDCPNIVSLFGGGELGEMFYLTLEYVPGTTLRQRLLKKEKFSVSEFLDVARQLCAGLGHAHARQVYHGNLVPWNLIFENDGTLKIMDFGLARTLVASDSRDDSDYVPYLSPEQLRGQPIDARSDLFSAACILYEMLAGRRAFEGSSREQIVQNVLDGFAPPAHESSIMIHPGLSAVLAKALAKDPGDRYQRGADLIRELENYKSFGAAQTAATKPAASAAVVEVPASPPAVAPKPAPPAAVAPPTPRASAPLPAASAVIPPPIPAPTAAGTARKPASQPASPRPASAKSWRATMPVLTNDQILKLTAGILLVLLVVVSIEVWRTRQRPDVPVAVIAPAEPMEEPAAKQPAELAESPASNEEAPAATAKPRARRVQQVTATAVVAPATGDLVVTSTPDGAAIQIDGQSNSAWTTPYTKTSLPPGTHTVVLTKPGYMADSRGINVITNGKAYVNVTLQPEGATVSVTSVPAGATITVDGKETGQITPAKLTLSAGAHTLAVSKNGFLQESTTTTLARGQQFQYAATLKTAGYTQEIRTTSRFKKVFTGTQEMGTVEVKTTPKGASVKVNGQPVPKVTPVSFTLNPGNYDLEITLAGYAPVREIVGVDKGGKIKVEKQLSKN